MTQVPHSEDVLLLHNIVYKLLVTIRLSERQYRPTIFGGALGMSYVPPEVDEGWRGRNHQVRNPSRRAENKTLHWCALRRAVARF